MKIILAIVIVILIASALDAKDIPLCCLSDTQAVRIIMGEAAGEVYRGKLAIACVLRNRNSANGFYGTKRSIAWCEAQGPKAHADSLRAWRESANNDITGGCTLEGGMMDDYYFQHTLHLKPVLTIGRQRFYKLK